MVERMIESMLRLYRSGHCPPIFPISPLFLTFSGSPQAAVWELVAPNLFIQRMTACAGYSCTLRASLPIGQALSADVLECNFGAVNV